MKDVKYADLEGALNLEVTDNKQVDLAVNTTSVRRDARVRLASGERILFEAAATIAPDAPFARDVALPDGVREEGLRLTLLASDGTELVSYESVARQRSPEPRRYEPPPPPRRVKTVEELYLAGLRLEQFHDARLDPDPYYREALRRDPGDARANTALGLLALRRGLFGRPRSALRRLSPA
jgi:hypothetical protein